MSSGNKIVKDGEHIIVPMALMDNTSLDSALGGRDSAHRLMIDRLSTAWRGGPDDALSCVGDAEAAVAASIAAASATSRRIADARPEAENAHREMISRISNGWKS